MRNPPLVNGNIYHIYNRGVDKRKIFLDKDDYFRFLHDLYEFNDENPAENIYYKLPNFQSYEIGSRKIEKKRRKTMVEIQVFCLMPNHYHLLIKQKMDGGIVKFIQKLGIGYAMYFNQKYNRVGTLFQGKFKAKLIDKENYLLHLPYYIHANPLKLKFPKWKEDLVKKDFQKATKFLENYRWSSFPDYIGKKNFPSITQREFLSKLLGNEKELKKNFFNWLKEKEDKFDVISDIKMD